MRNKILIISAIFIVIFLNGTCYSKSNDKSNMAGLYFKGRLLPKVNLNFIKRPSEGLRINHYADGKYYVEQSALKIGPSGRYLFKLIPNSPITFGGLDRAKGTAFEVKRAFNIYKVQEGDQFVEVIDGKKTGEVIKYKAKTISNKIKAKHQGLIQRNEQIIQIEVNLSAGKYVMFESEGNVFDKDTYPKREQACWYLEIVGERSIDEQQRTIDKRYEKIEEEWISLSQYLNKRIEYVRNLLTAMKGGCDAEINYVDDLDQAVQKLDQAQTRNDIINMNLSMKSLLSRLFIEVEKCPNVKSDPMFNSQVEEMASNENRISVAKKRYDDAVRDYYDVIDKSSDKIKKDQKEAAYFNIQDGGAKAKKIEF